jgi:hypothetical protein
MEVELMSVPLVPGHFAQFLRSAVDTTVTYVAGLICYLCRRF